MFIELTKDKILIEADRNILEAGDFSVWFKGYFFVGDNFHTNRTAAKHLLYLFENNSLKLKINNCNGIFTCIIIDKKNKEITICNDRFGFGHLFYNQTNNSLFISSDFWKLSEHLEKPEINLEAYSELLLMRYVFEDHTMIKGISEVIPASIYQFNFKNGKLNKKHYQYWSFQYNPVETDKKEAERNLFNILDKIISGYSKNLFPNKTIGLNLTGGIDSRFLLSLMRTNGISGEDINTFTYGDQQSEDISIAKKVAKIAGTDHISFTFDYPFLDFFKTDIIDKLIHEIGFSCTYYQGYGIDKLAGNYKKTDFLLTGSDGFAIGLMANEKLFSLKNEGELTDYLFSINAPRMASQYFNQLLGKNTGVAETEIKQKIKKYIAKKSDDNISSFYEWTFRNKIRKNILSIYEVLSRDTTPLFPYYDYEFFDFMLSLPPDSLYHQHAYVNAMCKYSFKGNFREYRHIPVEKRMIKSINDDFSLQLKKRSLVYRGIKKVFALPEKHFTYTTYKTYRTTKKRVTALIDETVKGGSDILDIDYLQYLLNANRRNEPFFYYGLPAILTVIRFENKLKSIISKSDAGR